MKKIQKGKLIVGVSGGKDSTATCLHLIHNLKYKIEEFDRVFIDTGWEEETTYDYLNYLEKIIGPIKRLSSDIPIKKHQKEIDYFENRIGRQSQMIRLIFSKINFPVPLFRWCTSELKINPLKEYLANLDCDYTNVTGIRKEESQKRSQLSEYEWSNGLDCLVWRPILNWKERDVINIHQKHNVIPNQLYLDGANRVGCYPCINANKKQIKMLSTERVELISDLEKIINNIRVKRGLKKVSFFSRKNVLNFNNSHEYMHSKIPIKELRKWSFTKRGGKQYVLFDITEPNCVKWGLCHLPYKK